MFVLAIINFIEIFKSYVNPGETCPLYFRWASARQWRGKFSLMNPGLLALEIETTDWNGHFFDRQKFWRWRLPLYFMTFIILAKDVVTFGSFNSIDGDGQENDKKSVRLG